MPPDKPRGDFGRNPQRFPCCAPLWAHLLTPSSWPHWSTEPWPFPGKQSQPSVVHLWAPSVVLQADWLTLPLIPC